MPTDRDLLKKLDTLLSKHRNPIGRSNENIDDIPLLTDIVDPIDIPSPTPAPDVASFGPVLTPASSALSSINLSDAEVEALARDIFHHVMSELSDRASSELRLHLTERLSSIIDATVTTAIDDFKQGLADVVGDAIAGALLERVERIATGQGAIKRETTND